MGRGGEACQRGRASAGRPAEGAEFYVQGQSPSNRPLRERSQGARAAGFPFFPARPAVGLAPDPGSESSPQPPALKLEARRRAGRGHEVGGGAATEVGASGGLGRDRGCGGRAGVVGGGGWDTGGETWQGSRGPRRIQVGAGWDGPGRLGIQVGCGVQTAGAPSWGRQAEGRAPSRRCGMPPLPAALHAACALGPRGGAGRGGRSGTRGSGAVREAGREAVASASPGRAPLPPGSLRSLRDQPGSPSGVAALSPQACGLHDPEPQFTRL